MPGPLPEDATPCWEELTELVRAKQAVIDEQAATIAELRARIADLERRVGRNPRNSSMPPSAEGLNKPPVQNRAQRRAAKRKPGKQPGTDGKHLAQVADPTRSSCTTRGPVRDAGGISPTATSSTSRPARFSSSHRTSGPL